MNVFRLPKRLCNEMFAMMAKFWWGKGGETKEIHWKSWNSVGRSKVEEGLGFRNTEDFKMAFFSKAQLEVFKRAKFTGFQSL